MVFTDVNRRIITCKSPLVIAVMARDTGKSLIASTIASLENGIIITNNPNYKKDYGIDVNNVYTPKEYFEDGRSVYPFRTLIIDDIDYMNLSEFQIHSLLDGYIKRVVVLGTPKSLKSKIKCMGADEFYGLTVEFESDILNLYFKAKKNKDENHKADLFVVPNHSDRALKFKEQLLSEEYEKEFLLENQ